MPNGILTPCNVARSRHWFRQVTAPCSVACGSGIVTVNSPSGSTCNVTRGCGMTCHWIRPNVRHIGILHLVSISTHHRSRHCHSAPVCEILSKSDHPRQKMTSCRFSRWRISAILNFWGPIMGSLKSPCTTSCESSITTIAQNCLVFEKIVFLAFWRQTDRQTNRQPNRRTNRWTAPMH